MNPRGMLLMKHVNITKQLHYYAELPVKSKQ